MKTFKQLLKEAKLSDVFTKDGDYLVISDRELKIVYVKDNDIKRTIYRTKLAQTTKLPSVTFLN